MNVDCMESLKMRWWGQGLKLIFFKCTYMGILQLLQKLLSKFSFSDPTILKSYWLGWTNNSF